MTWADLHPIEFNEPRNAGKPVLAFMAASVPREVDPSRIDPADLARLQKFITRLRSEAGLCAMVDSPQQLSTVVLQALYEWRSDAERAHFKAAVRAPASLSDSVAEQAMHLRNALLREHPGMHPGLTVSSDADTQPLWDFLVEKGHAVHRFGGYALKNWLENAGDDDDPLGSF